MGLLDWIGEAIGKAFNTLAEFIGDAMETAFSATLGNLFVVGDKLLKQMLIEVKGSDTEINSNATALSKLMETEFIDDANKAINTALDYEGTLDPGEATRVLKALYGPIDEHMISGVIFALIAEIVSLGQVEGVQQLLAMEDKMKGFSDLASTYRRMQNEVGLFQSYRKELNARYQNIIPGPTDLIRMQLREVFHPDYRDELLLPSPSDIFKTAMKEQGFNEYWSDSYWAAHWVLPSMGDLDELLHRRFISPEEWEIMVRRNDYLPAWIPNRKKIIYKPYTRVDTRRMWDLRSLSEQEVYENYQDLGYDEDHARKMTTWTKLYVIAVELRARYSKGWISAADVKSEIIAAGMSPSRAEIWVQKIIKPDQETRTEKERDVTKSEIVKGVKTGVITREDGIELLVGMGYDDDEANYILEINIPIDEEDEVVKERQLTKADILKALKTEVITRDEAKDQLMDLRYPSAAAEMLLNIFDAQVDLPPTMRLREASKADIVLGVKKGLITQEEGYGMLLDLGFTANAAIFILAVKTEESPFSPINYEEFWNLVNLRRKSLGLSVKIVPEELKELEKQIWELEDLQREGVRAGESEKFFTELDKTLDPLKERYLTLKETGTGSDKTTEAPTSKKNKEWGYI